MKSVRLSRRKIRAGNIIIKKNEKGRICPHIGEIYKSFQKNFGKDVVDKYQHSSIIHTMNLEILRLMIENLYVLRFPGTDTSLCVGEEICKRSKIKSYTKNDKGKTIPRMIFNGIKRPTFRMWWNKSACNISCIKLMHFYNSRLSKKMINEYSKKREQSGNSYRAYPILR